MDHRDPEEDPTSDYGDSIATSEFTSVNTQELYSYEHGRCVAGPYYTPSMNANLLGDIKDFYVVVMAYQTTMLSRSVRA
jgi:hypothetical protein